ncbi:pheromone A receptor-domain-containing protein [Mucidula mucida]|nr:pheromone A receptor-domain-containing protein [Mucidula mucida]
MHAELAVFSLLSVLIISLILFYRPFWNNSTVIALALWLVVCNAVYGVDAILWADNTNVHIPGWCDIVTRILLAANVALPGACLGISVDLSYTKKMRLIYDITLCFLIPIFYISLHFIVQGHRFDIVKDFGCVASIYPSTLSAVMMALPAVIICMVALSFSAWAIHSTYQRTSAELAHHLATRSDFSIIGFRSRLVASILITVVSLTTTSISVSATGTSSSWTSWARTHAETDTIDVSDNIRVIQTAWFGVFIISFLFIMTSVVELKRLDEWGRWIPSSMTRLVKRTGTPSQDILLPTVHTNRGASLSDFHAQPHDVALVSGWDEMLHVRPGKKSRPKPLSMISAYDGGRRSDDDVFAADTYRYLQSPVARSLGLTSSSPTSLSPSPIVTYPTPPPLDSLMRATPSPEPWIPISSSIPDPDSTIYRRRPSVPEDAVSTISTLYDIPWPQPPAEALPSRVSNRFSTVDGTEYPITRALLDQRKTPPVRISSKRYPKSIPESPKFDTNVFLNPGKAL